jgi:subtilisin family serine protease
MSWTYRRHIGLWFALLTIPFAASAGEYHYAYFDQSLPLGLDSKTLAVAVDPDTDWTAVHDQFGQLGATPRRIHALPTPNWYMATLPAARSAADCEALVAQLADSDALAFVSPVFIDRREQPLLMTEVLHVGFQLDADANTIAQTLAEIPGVVEAVDFAGLPGVYRIRTTLRDGFAVLALANDLARRPEVRFAESDMIVRGELLLMPDDPMFSSQWGLHQASDNDMDLPEAWDITTGDDSIKVVVLDIGIQQNHPDIHQVPGQDFHGSEPGGGPETMCDNHGTLVAGCISAHTDNGVGIAGIAPQCNAVSGKVGTSFPFIFFCLPTFDSQPSMLANALNWAVDTGARVTNASISYTDSSMVTTAYANARAAGLVHFAATGNDGSSSISYPSSLSTVNAVGALNSSGSRASFSQYGSGIAFSAPGENIATCDRTGSDGYDSGDYTTADGTSFASPNAAAVAALILSLRPDFTPDEVEEVMEQTCVDLGSLGYDTTYGWGFVNAYNAVQAVAITSLPGDLNCDEVVNFDDINPFVLALSSPDVYATQYPDCPFENRDINADGLFDFSDINPFVTLLAGP